MCTLIILRRPGHAWPALVAANRDEMAGRPWRAPARHWADREDVTAGLDLEAGGSWLGMNDAGVVAGVLNRPGALGPQAGKRSRGELVLEALDHADAAAAAAALRRIDGRAYRPSNLAIADNREAWWLKLGEGGGAVERRPIGEGLSMLTSRDLNDPACPRMARQLPRLRAAPAPDPGAGDWGAWKALLAETEPEGEALAIRAAGGFGTVSSSLIALPAAGRAGAAPVWLFAAGLPGRAPWRPLPAAPAAVYDGPRPGKAGPNDGGISWRESESPGSLARRSPPR